MTQGTPPAEVEITVTLVRNLLADQHPDLAALPITPLDSGWDNAMFRLGDGLVVRLPRREIAAQLILNEQNWLGVVARDLPIPCPVPVRVGVPGCGYPWSWSVLPWLPGQTADLAAPSHHQATILGEFLRQLQVDAPENAPKNLVRGGPLAERAATVEPRLARLSEVLGPLAAPLRAVWDAALAAPATPKRVWLHGDLHARNVLVDSGIFSGIVDWGDITSGDCATDLAAFWALFEDKEARRAGLAAFQASDAEIARGMGWAVLFGSILLETGLTDNSRHAKMGADTLRRVAEEFVAVGGN